MTFFNKKEEVYDLVLTRLGRELFSQDKFNPAWYAFYDNEVLYDLSCGPSNTTEAQNETVGRIKDANIFKNQTDWQGAVLWKGAKQFKKQPDLFQLGKYSPFEEVKPAWDLKLGEGFISGTIDYIPDERVPNTNLESDYVGERIPQISTVCEYVVHSIDDTDVLEDAEKQIGDIKNKPNDNEAILQKRTSDDLYISLEEFNVPDTEENFNLEIYEYIYGEDNNVTGMKKLFFSDEGVGPDFVGHYFDITTDAIAEEEVKIKYIDEGIMAAPEEDDPCETPASKLAAAEAEYAKMWATTGAAKAAAGFSAGLTAAKSAMQKGLQGMLAAGKSDPKAFASTAAAQKKCYAKFNITKEQYNAAKLAVPGPNWSLIGGKKVQEDIVQCMFGGHLPRTDATATVYRDVVVEKAVMGSKSPDEIKCKEVMHCIWYPSKDDPTSGNAAHFTNAKTAYATDPVNWKKTHPEYPAGPPKE